MRRNPEVAARALRELGDLVVVTSENSRKSEVRLGEELELLERYLRIERLRFGDRLRFQLDVPPETLDVPVPPFILQPLVENAVTHGVGHRVSGGTVVVRARQRERSLLLEVKDDGVGIARGELVEGIGLRNTRERIHQLYGDEGRFELDASPGEGFGVSIGIPFRSWRANVFAP
jgi:two-component system, LytTR family, sensor kinase